jgi:hypothetical protein
MDGHLYEWAKPAGASLFARIVTIVSQVTDAQEAALLSREAALKLGFDATQDRGAMSGRVAAADLATRLTRALD